MKNVNIRWKEALNGAKSSGMDQVKLVEDSPKKFEVFFQRLSSTNFTWSILEYFVSNNNHNNNINLLILILLLWLLLKNY